MEQDTLIILSAFVMAALITIFALRQNKPLLDALTDAIRQFQKDVPAVDRLEGAFLGWPPEVQRVARALVDLAEKASAGTPVLLDDEAVRLARMITDGLPNAPGEAGMTGIGSARSG